MIKQSISLRSLLFVLIICFLHSCNYYKIRTTPIEGNAAENAILESKSNFHIIHLNDSLYQIKNLSIIGESISGSLTKLPSKVEDYYNKAVVYNNYRVKKDDKHFISQFHMHVSQYQKSDDIISFNTSDITRIDVLNKNKGLSTLSKVGTTALVTAGGLGIFLAVVCNCPHVYTYDGTTYHYNNTLFTGATSEVLERDDYKGIPDHNPDSYDYNIIIKNEEKELQYTNLLELVVVNHDSNVEVGIDQNGTIYALKDQIQPINIVDDNGADLMDVLGYNDDLGYVFDNSGDTDFKNVYATFNKPANTSDAKLVIKAKNSRWGKFVYNEFSKLFGKNYENWVEKNHKKSKEKVVTNMAKAGMLMVISVKQGDKWVDIESIDLIGEVTYNSLVVPIDPSLLTGEQIEVRIRSGFMFWDLDYVNIDFTPTTELDVQYLSPFSASGSNDTNNMISLKNDDDMYMEHLVKGDYTNIVFTGIAPSNSSIRTIFLHSKGYYLTQDTFDGKMQRRELVKIKGEGGMSKYSERLFNELFLTYALSHE